MTQLEYQSTELFVPNKYTNLILVFLFNNQVDLAYICLKYIVVNCVHSSDSTEPVSRDPSGLLKLSRKLGASLHTPSQSLVLNVL